MLEWWCCGVDKYQSLWWCLNGFSRNAKTLGKDIQQITTIIQVTKKLPPENEIVNMC